MKNKVIRMLAGEEHVLYEVSAEIFLELEQSALFHELFRDIPAYEQRVLRSLSHTRSEAERTAEATSLMKDVWQARVDFAPYLPANLLATFEYERLFYPKYRDHSVHQLRVLLLGAYLYVKNRSLRDALQTETAIAVPHAASSRESLDRGFLRLWTVTALFHDQGYLFEQSIPGDPRDAKALARVFEDLNKLFDSPLKIALAHTLGVDLPAIKERRARTGLRLPQTFRAESFDDLLFEPDGQSTILDRIESFVDVHGLGPTGSALRRYFEMARNESAKHRPRYIDHGIASAVMLLRTNKELDDYLGDMAKAAKDGQLRRFIESDETRDAICAVADLVESFSPLIRHAAAAIAVHNVDKQAWDPAVFASARYNLSLETYEVALDRSPLAFLLLLSDALQDWDRPRFFLPATANEHIRIDQRMLIAANDEHVGLSIFGDDGSPDPAVYREFVGYLASYMRAPDVRRLLSPVATISRPEQLSAESIDQVRHRERLQARHRYEALADHWAQYSVNAAESKALDASEGRSQRIAMMNHFLDWCEQHRYHYFKRDYDSQTEAIYRKVRLEINELNYVVEGSQIQGRRIENSIGAGGYGTVWRTTRDQRDAAEEAFKIFHTSNFASEELVGRFRRGYQSMRQLAHPQITKVFDYVLVPRGYFLELIHGPNVKDFFFDRSHRKMYYPTLKDRLILLREIAEILEYAHRQGVIHRDIKPENIILRWSNTKDRYEPVLTDFDLAWFAQSVTLTIGADGDVVGGSALYAAPEQRRPHDDTYTVHQPTVDVFGFGRLMYFVLATEHPKEDIDLAKALTHELNHSFPGVPKSASLVIIELFRKATRVQPRDRFQTIAELRTKLGDLMSIMGVGDMATNVWLLELALRMDRADLPSLDDHASAVAAGKIEVSFSGGTITLSAPKNGRLDQLDLRVDVLDPKYLSSIHKSFAKARENLNERLTAILDDSKVPWTDAQRGTTGQTYSFSARLELPAWNLASVSSLETCVQKIRMIGT
ncbi:MAG TPA: serine/threonine-protein kinase [Kofleriaceae bacterium]|jgi:serine/threonine protein kinase|nr:serine/threonine-protein kinase [Kofleriaceae bacterium]